MKMKKGPALSRRAFLRFGLNRVVLNRPGVRGLLSRRVPQLREEEILIEVQVHAR